MDHHIVVDETGNKIASFAVAGDSEVSNEN